MGVSRLGVVPKDPQPPATESLLELVAEDADAGALLRRASRHVVPSDREPSKLRQMLYGRGHRYSHEEVEAAVYEVSLELLPGSWAAARERLRLRTERPVSRLADGAKRKPPPTQDAPTGPPPEDAIAAMLADDTACLREVASLSLYPLVGEELLRVSRRLWRALRARGRHYRGRHFSDHVAAVVKELFPHSPGAAWSSEWAQAVAHAGTEYVSRRTPIGARPVPSEEEEEAFAEIRAAAESEDRRAYRLAVRRWVDAMLAPFEDADAG